MKLFDSFTKEELSQLFSPHLIEIRQYDKGQLVHLQAEVCGQVDIILRGELAVQNIIESGNVLTLSVISARDIVGASLIFSSRNVYPMTVAATCPTTLLHLKRELIVSLCNSSERFMLGFMGAISDKTLFLTDRINAISLKTIRESIIDFLSYESLMQKNHVVTLGMSKKDLAQRLGVQRTSLSRELNKMRKDGLVQYNARTITLKELDAHKK